MNELTDNSVVEVKKLPNHIILPGYILELSPMAIAFLVLAHDPEATKDSLLDKLGLVDGDEVTNELIEKGLAVMDNDRLIINVKR